MIKIHKNPKDQWENRETTTAFKIVAAILLILALWFFGEDPLFKQLQIDAAENNTGFTFNPKWKQ